MQSGLAQRTSGKVDREELARELLGPNGNDGPAHTFARNLVKRRRDLLEIAHDAATDAVMWALDKYDPERHRSFRGLALRTVKNSVWARVKNHYRSRTDRGEYRRSPEPEQTAASAGRVKRKKRHVPHVELMGEFSGEYEAKPITDDRLPEGLAERLTAEELRAVRLYYIGGYTTRECGKILGVHHSTIEKHLKRVAELTCELRDRIGL